MWYFLIFYLIFLLGFLIYSIAAIYHLWRFGYVGDLTKPAIAVYTALSILIVASTLLYIAIRLIGN
ncbi:MAG: hypothetical protein BWY68_00209 [bacterium ADurb.Bin400]|nr:MAG: hypothetical protein BWY68_00209 [bacterium ADurb.Bin400]